MPTHTDVSQTTYAVRRNCHGIRHRHRPAITLHTRHGVHLALCGGVLARRAGVKVTWREAGFMRGILKMLVTSVNGDNKGYGNENAIGFSDF